MMNGGPISWKSQCQDNLSHSTSQPGFVAASQAGQEAIYLRETLTNFGFSQTKATLLYEDNLACVAMSANPVRRKFSCLCARTKWWLMPSPKAFSPRLVGHRQIMTGHASFAVKLLRCVGG